MNDSSAHLIAADWLVSMSAAQPIRRGTVRVGPDGIIDAVGPLTELAHPDLPIRYFASAVLTPGLVNAHAHLDLGHWQGRRDELANKPLHEWVLPIMSRRQMQTADEVASAAVASARASLAAGVTTVVDVTPAREPCGAVLDALAITPLRRVALIEAIGVGTRARQLWTDVEQIIRRLARPKVGAQHVQLGLSPHAPYSTDRWVYQQVMALARSASLPVMTHLSETREEIEFLRTGRGPWRAVLQSRYGPDLELDVPGCSPVEFAERIGLLDHPTALLAHVNYLEPGDLDRFAAGKASVVYCPRSADFLGHRDHPWQKLLAAGVNVAVGTDSPASAPDVSILGELQFLQANHPDASAEDIFALATTNAARAIGAADRIGCLQTGALADLAVWPIRTEGDTCDALLGELIQSAPPPVTVFVGGSQVM